MRMIAGIFGVVCGSILIAMVARYGYKTADTEIDGVITAILFAMITAGGLWGHAFAVRLWRHNRLASVIVGLIVTVALVVSLSNSVGAIAGRGDERTATRMKIVQSIKDDRAELARITRERETMPTFQVTTTEAVQFAREAVAAAERTAKAECDRRGNFCRERESDERARRGELAQVVANRAATERAAQLDTEMIAIRGRVAQVSPVGTVNPQAVAILQVFGLPDSEAATAIYYGSPTFQVGSLRSNLPATR